MTTQRRTYSADPDRVAVREPADEDDADGLFRIRMPVSSTAEARDGDAFSRDRLEGWVRQIDAGDVGVFLDHGRNHTTGSRYSALGKLGYWADPAVEDRDGGAELVADAVLMDPAELDADLGDLRMALETLRAQATAGVPLASSVGWSEDTGDRDLPGDSDLLEISIVGIPSDPNTTTASAEPAAMARAVSAAASDFDVEQFVRELSREATVDGALLTYGVGGVAVEDQEQYEAFADELVEDHRGTLLDLKTSANPDVEAVRYPPDLPDAHDPHILVQGVEAETVAEVMSGYDGVNFDDPTSRSHRNVVEVGGEEVDLTPPEAVVNAATVALAKDDELKPDCGTGAGRESAQQIAGDEVTAERIDDIAVYLTSHEEDVTADGPPTDWSDEEWQDCGNLQYALWGGTGTGTGLEWAQDRANAVADAKDEELPYPDRAGRNLDDPEFSPGDAVMWTWQDEPVHGRVNDIHEQYTPPEADEPITGEEGEAVYSIYEYDDETEELSETPNVGKPESSLSESEKDIPTRETMTDDDTPEEGDENRDEPTLRDMEQKMDEVREMCERMESMQEEMYEEMMGGSDEEAMDDEDDEDGSEDDDEEESADAGDRTVTIDGEERDLDGAAAHIRELREAAGDADLDDSKTQNRATDDTDTDETDSGAPGYGFAGMEE